MRTTRRTELGLFVVALCARLLLALVLVEARGAASWYAGNESSQIAVHLATGQGFSGPYANIPIRPTAQQPPVYPALLALIFLAFGIETASSLGVVLFLNALAGALTAVVLVRLGRKFGIPTAGWVAGVVWAVWPDLALEGLSLGNNGWCALVVAASALVVPPVLRSGRKWELLLLGAGVGLAAMLNPVVLMVAVAFVVGEAVYGQLRGELLLVGVGAMVLLAPWTVRNAFVFDRLVPVRDNFGMELWLGNHPGMVGTVDFSSFSREFPEHPRYAALGEIPFMETTQTEAMEFIRQEPRLFMFRLAHRVVEFWSMPIPRLGSPSLEKVQQLLWGGLSVLAWVGMAVALRERNEIGVFLLATLALFPMTYYVTHVWPTYRHPIEPFMVLAAAVAVVRARPRGHSVWDAFRNILI